MSEVRISLGFDMRAPDWGTPRAELYAAAIDMAAFADRIGVGRINLTEHHGSEDGYLPAPFVMGGSVAAVTSRCRISLGAVILPLHDPVLVAEQIAILDILSGGRLDVIFGAGYVPSEFAAFGVSLSERAKRLDTGIDLILRALSGERFETTEGRPVFVRPLPVQRPEDILLVGGSVPASARRAARFGLGIAPSSEAILPLYIEECTRLGRAPGRMFGTAPRINVHIAEDPDAAWAALRPHVAHVIRAYGAWADQKPGEYSPYRDLGDIDALRANGLFAVWTPDEFVERCAHMDPLHSMSMAPLLGGLDPEAGWRSLRLLETVMPRIREIEVGRAAT